jgi:DNA-3-methyladenine glycosylase
MLVREAPGIRRVARIVEVEAYLGAEDPASHAYRGLTGRNRPMFGEVGHTYVYVSYGVHHCLNLVAKAPGRAAGAVLIRAAEPLEGFSDVPRALAGPGLIGRGFALTTAHSGLDLLSSELSLHDAPRVPDAQVGRSARIGLSGGHTLGKPWRLYVRGSPAVSRSPRL